MKEKNLSLTRSDSYGYSINALVTDYQYQYYVTSSTIYAVLVHSHLMQDSQGLCEIDLILHAREETTILEDSVFCYTSQWKQSGCPSTALLSVPQTHSACCYTEIMQSCNFLSFAMSMTPVLGYSIDTLSGGMSVLGRRHPMVKGRFTSG